MSFNTILTRYDAHQGVTHSLLAYSRRSLSPGRWEAPRKADGQQRAGVAERRSSILVSLMHQILSANRVGNSRLRSIAARVVGSTLGREPSG